MRAKKLLIFFITLLSASCASTESKKVIVLNQNNVAELMQDYTKFAYCSNALDIFSKLMKKSGDDDLSRTLSYNSKFYAISGAASAKILNIPDADVLKNMNVNISHIKENLYSKEKRSTYITQTILDCQKEDLTSRAEDILEKFDLTGKEFDI
jgi:hypothetical protein